MIAPQRVPNATSSRPSINRVLVVLLVLCWLLVAAQLPYSLHGAGIVVLLTLVALDAVLGVTTGWLAFQSTSRLDERQAALRDRAYRIGFRLVGAGVLTMFLLYIIGSILQAILLGPQSRSTSDGFSPRTVLAILELLAVAPTAVSAWLLPTESESTNRAAPRWLPLIAVPVVALAWVVSVLAAPLQTTVLATFPDNSFTMGAAHCGHFGAVKRVASGFGGATRLEAEVCWNGQQAFTYGDPSLPRPMSLPAEEFSMAFPGLTSCVPLPSDTDFGNVVEHCTGNIDGDGTLHLVLNGRVSPLPGGAGARVVQIRLVVTRDGKLVTFD
jgi:hypothetical protein